MKAAIPTVRTGDPALDRALDAMKQNLDALSGQARNATRLQPLSGTATQAQIIEQLNAILARLQ
jgi:hypothetical protein